MKQRRADFRGGGKKERTREEEASVAPLFTQRPLRQSKGEAFSVFLTEWICSGYFLLSAFAPSQSLLCQADELLPNIESGVIIVCYWTACVVWDDCVSSWMCEVSCPVKACLSA